MLPSFPSLARLNLITPYNGTQQRTVVPVPGKRQVDCDTPSNCVSPLPQLENGMPLLTGLIVSGRLAPSVWLNEPEV